MSKKKKTNAEKVIKKRNDNIDKILAKVHEMCDYAAENLCIEDSYFDDLKWMLCTMM